MHFEIKTARCQSIVLCGSQLKMKMGDCRLGVKYRVEQKIGCKMQTADCRLQTAEVFGINTCSVHHRGGQL